MKFWMVKKQTIVKRFGFHTLHRNITYLTIIARKTFMQMENLKCWGGGEKEPKYSKNLFTYSCWHILMQFTTWKVTFNNLSIFNVPKNWSSKADHRNDREHAFAARLHLRLINFFSFQIGSFASAGYTLTAFFFSDWVLNLIFNNILSKTSKNLWTNKLLLNPTLLATKTSA